MLRLRDQLRTTRWQALLATIEYDPRIKPSTIRILTAVLYIVAFVHIAYVCAFGVLMLYNRTCVTVSCMHFCRDVVVVYALCLDVLQLCICCIVVYTRLS